MIIDQLFPSKKINEAAPPGARAERMVRHIKQGYSQDGKLTPREKGIAFATAWKAHNAGQVEEGEYQDDYEDEDSDPDIAHYFDGKLDEQGIAEGSEDLVRIEYWQQDTMESGRWVKTKSMPRATAEKIVGSFDQGEIVDVEQGLAESVDHHAEAEDHLSKANDSDAKGDKKSFHTHMANHHEALSMWHDSKGRSASADKHMDKADYHHEKSLSEEGMAEGSLNEYGDTEKGQKMLTKVQKRAVDRVTSRKADTDPAYAKKNSDTAKRAWDRMSNVDEQGVAEGSDLDAQAMDIATKLTTGKNLEILRGMAYDSTVYRALDRYFAKHNIPETIYNRVAHTVFKKINQQGVTEANHPKFVGFMNKAMSDKVDTPKADSLAGAPDWYKNAPTADFKSIPSHKKALKFGLAVLSKLDAETKHQLAAAGEQDICDYIQDVAERTGNLGRGGFAEEDIWECQDYLSDAFHDPNITSWVDVLQPQQGVAESDTLMTKLKTALIKEGRVKELAGDLKTLTDAEFMKKYGKAKAAIRADMTKMNKARTDHNSDKSSHMPSKITELSTNKLAQYKTAAAKDAQAADQAGDFKRSDRRFHGMVQATNKQFDNDAKKKQSDNAAKKVDESRAARRALMARIANGR